MMERKTNIGKREFSFNAPLAPVKIDKKLTLGYWVKRCELAEKYINESPCDPDIYEDQLKAYREWKDFIEEKL